MIMDSTTISGHEALKTDLPIDMEEDFVNSVYASVDKAAAGELARLRGRDGIVPTCSRGCNHCCHHHILTSSLEAHKLAQHIKREFSEQQIMELKMRTRQWHAWDRNLPGRYPSEKLGHGNRSYKLPSLLPSERRWCMQRLSGKACGVSGSLCQFTCFVLYRFE